MGHVESGMELLAAMGDEFEVTMELVDESDLNTEDTSAETTEITMTAGDTVISAILDNSETTQEFLSTLPRTIEMNRYDDREYYGRPVLCSFLRWCRTFQPIRTDSHGKSDFPTFCF